jgi:predicted SprT family Zn-dependent metalloprotease
MRPEIRDEIRELREKFPPLFPVRVYFRSRAAMGSAWADCELRDRKHFTIRICAGQSLAFTQYLLRHEWAHAVAWREGHETVCDHDPEWALAFARIYQELVEP